MMWQCKPSLLAISIIMLSGCASNLNPQQRERAPSALPTQWQQAAAKSVIAVNDTWFNKLASPTVKQLVTQALKNNQQLRQERFDVEIQKQQLIITGAALWPSLDISSRVGRSKNNRPVSYNNSISVSLELGYEIDLWGKL